MDLFADEERILAAAELWRGQLATLPDEVREGVEALIAGFRRSVREQRRLLKVSDRLQEQLTARQAETAEALDRLKATQETLIQADKLASLGALVAGVAHEINTPIGIALSCSSHLADETALIRALFTADDVGVDDFERYMATAGDTARLIQANCERAAALVRSFKQVAVDRTTAEHRRFDLRETLAETLVSLSPGLRQAGHAVELDCPEGLAIDGCPGALSQVLTNLVMNSLIHAYAPGQRGRLSITASVAADGSSVTLVYADDGSGIADADKGRVFDPFFTTRRGQGGTGLGLHIVYSTVVGVMGGTIAVDDAPGGGARFTVTFPVSVPG